MVFKPSTNTLWIVSGSKFHWIYYTAVTIVWACALSLRMAWDILCHLDALQSVPKTYFFFLLKIWRLTPAGCIQAVCYTKLGKFPMERAGTANSTNQTCALLEHEYHSGRETGGSQRKDGEGLKIKSIVDGFATWSTAVNAGTEKVERRKLMAHSSKGL